MAQLNSALDYGSRGYWFESSQGHKTPIDIGVFLCFEVKTPLKSVVRAKVVKKTSKSTYVHNTLFDTLLNTPNNYNITASYFSFE